ncbi:hypothetical protein EDD18DRAFT_1118814 [Armillaria luteobubalina]|uniref:Uncharacterized protein n=1 Tax=Armillaria luteobubalina TaxID=153913 RepID=A0AA39NUH5_9AGAR|nr:hypothetical protein EDD18DRAFT_1118814 [Armillaria luteobubalina]
MLEVETYVVDGRLSKVWKNLWPSIRAFLQSMNEHVEKTYLLFGKQCYTFQEILNEAVKCEAIFGDLYKGDRVVICSRTFPSDYIVFRACHPERPDKKEPIAPVLKRTSGLKLVLMRKWNIQGGREGLHHRHIPHFKTSFPELSNKDFGSSSKQTTQPSWAKCTLNCNTLLGPGYNSSEFVLLEQDVFCSLSGSPALPPTVAHFLILAGLIPALPLTV